MKIFTRSPINLPVKPYHLRERSLVQLLAKVDCLVLLGGPLKIWNELRLWWNLDECGCQFGLLADLKVLRVKFIDLEMFGLLVSARRSIFESYRGSLKASKEMRNFKACEMGLVGS